MDNRSLTSLVALLGAALASSAGLASAHVSVAGPGYAGQNQLLTFSVGHGCEGADTVSIEVAIPSAITSVRAMPSVFGPVTLNADATGVVTSVKYTKSMEHPLDELYYQFGIRLRLPDAPFTTLLFPTTQVCRAADGTMTTVEWAATPEELAAVPDGGAEPEPAPTLVILPPRGSGWNKYEAPAAISDLSVFDDAEIVWVGDAAYSSNPTTRAMIEDEDDVDELTKIAAGAEIWVKY
jgi:uncharacterized protein YcnI